MSELLIIIAGSMDLIVIALGGNALLSPSGEQSFSKENANMDRISRSIALLSKCYRIVITHGNGSQVGDELMRNEHAKRFINALPFYIINAETQAQIGSVIETSIRNSMQPLGIRNNVSVILSHVLVSGKDRAFRSPTKQIGPFYTKSELANELKLRKFRYIKSGQKYRRVVPSPIPDQILEIDNIALQSKSGVVIACGGGGIPVIKTNGTLKGIDAVIDKDLTTQLLANALGAKKMVILTNADCLYADYPSRGGPIMKVSAKLLKKNLSHFEEGTIRPKLEACIKFVENKGHEAIIGNIFKLDSIMEGKSGTRILE